MNDIKSNYMKSALFIISIVTSLSIFGVSQVQQPMGDSTDDCVIAIVDGKTLLEKDRANLRAVIFSELLNKYAKERKIDTTENEIDLFLRAKEEKENHAQKESEREKDHLLKELKNPSLSEEMRLTIDSKLKTIEDSLRAAKEMKKGAEKMREQLRPMMRNMAKQWIMKWKINKSLYEKYGGRVVFQQTGVEPIDAYRDFLRDQEKTGSFKITSEAEKVLFWDYFTNEKIHTFSEDKDALRLIATPWWLLK